VLIEKELAFSFDVWAYTLYSVNDIGLFTLPASFKYFTGTSYDNWILRSDAYNYNAYAHWNTYNDISGNRQPTYTGNFLISAQVNDFLESSYETDKGTFTPSQFVSTTSYIYAQNGETVDFANYNTEINVPTTTLSVSAQNSEMSADSLPTDSVIADKINNYALGVSMGPISEDFAWQKAYSVSQGIVNTESGLLSYRLSPGVTKYVSQMCVKSATLAWDRHQTWDSPSGIKADSGLKVSYYSRIVGYSVQNVAVKTQIDMKIRVVVTGDFALRDDLTPQDETDPTSGLGDIVFTPLTDGDTLIVEVEDEKTWVDVLRAWWDEYKYWILGIGVIVVIVVLLNVFAPSITNLILLTKK